MASRLLFLVEFGAAAADGLAQQAAVAHQLVALGVELVEPRLQFGNARAALAQLGALGLGGGELGAELGPGGLLRACGTGAGQQPSQRGGGQGSDENDGDDKGWGHPGLGTKAAGAAKRGEAGRPCPGAARRRGVQARAGA